MNLVSRLKNRYLEILCVFVLLVFSFFFIHIDQITDILPPFLEFKGQESFIDANWYFITQGLYGVYFNVIDFFVSGDFLKDILDLWIEFRNWETGSGCNLFEITCSSEYYNKFYFSNDIYYLNISLKVLLLAFVFVFSKILYKQGKMSKNVFWFIFLNPIFYIVTFVYGRPEVLWLIPFFSSIFFLRDKKYFYSIVLFALAILVKFVAVLFLPFYLVFFFRNYFEKFDRNKLFITLGTLVLFSILGVYYREFILDFSISLFEHPRVLDLFALKYSFFPEINIDNAFNVRNIYIFVMIYLVLFIYSFWKEKFSFNDFIYLNIVFLLLYFSFVDVPQQFFAWIIPFYAISYKEIKRFWTIHIFQIIPYAVIFFFVGGRYTFVPFVRNSGISHLGKDLVEVGISIDFINFGVIISGILFSLMVAANIFMAFVYLRKLMDK